MRLEFIYVPTTNLDAALALYRDTLGFDERWREGELTVGLGIPDNEAAVMIDAAAAPGSGPGPVYSVDRVDEWLASLEVKLDVFLPPSDIPGGRLMGFRDGDGNAVYVLDQSAGA
jgi:catechol 2,3-dioxygenase-like lactoylglutathione lyase family enzyme